MKRGSPMTLQAMACVKPIKKLARIVPLMLPSPPKTATRMAVVMYVQPMIGLTSRTGATRSMPMMTGKRTIIIVNM